LCAHQKSAKLKRKVSTPVLYGPTARERTARLG
jgi:hypothetical protein